MTEEAVANASDSRPYNGGAKSEDLMKKLLQVPGGSDFHVVMKQRNESRFFCIIELKENVRNDRIIVPMSYCVEFLNKLYEVLKFGSEYTPKNISLAKGVNGIPKFAHTASLHTKQGRRYYFDIVDEADVLSLRLSYVFMGRRDSVLIDLGSLVTFVAVIEKFQQEFPSLSEKDDDATYRGRRYDNRNSPGRRGGRYPRRFYNGGRDRGQAAQPGSQPARAPSTYTGPRPTFEEGADRKKAQGLKVCSDPAPYHFVNNAKKYTFEIVEGANTFMRITEVIGENRKSTLHVPIDCLNEIRSVLGDMNERFAALKETTTSQTVKS